MDGMERQPEALRRPDSSDTVAWGHRDVAAHLQAAIEGGAYPAGTKLPHVDELQEIYGKARGTIREALRLLQAEGLVEVLRGRGTIVRDRSAVLVPLSRYGQVMRSDSKLGPWQTACAAQGVEGRMVVVEHGTEVADLELAQALGVPGGSEIVYRLRHAMAGEKLAQVQKVWYAPDVASGTGLDGQAVVEGGAFGALLRRGHQPAAATEQVAARMPTRVEAQEFGISGSDPLLTVQRTITDSSGRVLEFQRAYGPASRLMLVYDGMPLAPVREETDRVQV